MRETRTSGSMSGKWKRSMAWLVRHRARESPGQQIGHAYPTAPLLDSTNEFLDWVDRYWSHDDETRVMLSECCFEVWER